MIASTTSSTPPFHHLFLLTIISFCLLSFVQLPLTFVHGSCTFYNPPHGYSTACAHGSVVYEGVECPITCDQYWIPSGYTYPKCNYNIPGSFDPAPGCFNLGCLYQLASGTSNCAIGQFTPVGSVCSITSCPAGYVATGGPISCPESGAWIGSQSCDLGPSCSFSIPNGAASSTCASGAVGSTTSCTVTCAGGYTGGGTTTCYSGSWSGSASCTYVPKSCTYSKPAYAVTTGCSNGQVVAHGGSCSFSSCQTNYDAIGGTITCNDGSWIGSQSCSYNPPAPSPCFYSVPTGAGSASCSQNQRVSDGGSCTLNYCATNYAQSGSVTITCSDGSWSGSQVCTYSPPPCTYYFPSNSALTGSCSSGASYSNGKQCTANCAGGYTSSGVDTCSGGSFSGQSCSPSACTNYQPPSGASGTPSCGIGSTQAHGTSCTSPCLPSYTPSGSDVCSYGSWSKGASCIPPSPCASYVVPLHATAGASCSSGSTQAHGTNCAAICDGGYTSSGSNICSSGTWSNGQTCNPSPCANYQPPAHYTGTPSCGIGSTQAHLTSCTSPCAAPYTASGSNTCSYGSWNGGASCLPPPDCTYSVPQNALTSGSTCTIGATYPYAKTCTAVCTGGYTSSGTDTCTGGSFSGQSCGPSPCPNYQPPAFSSGTPSCGVGSTQAHGASCTSPCLASYTAIGANVCSYGAWSNGASCVPPAPCANYKLPAFSTAGVTCADGSTQPHGTDCAAICKTGYTSSGSNTCASGIWSNNQVCTPNPCPAYTLPANAIAGNCTSGATLAHGTSCQAKCTGAYSSTGGLNVCSFGTWSNAQTCTLLPCSPYKLPKNSKAGTCASGAVVVSGTNCTAVCAPKAVPNNGTSSCMYGQWTEGQTCFVSSMITDIQLTTQSPQQNSSTTTQQNVRGMMTPNVFDTEVRLYRIDVPFATSALRVQPMFSDTPSSVTLSYRSTVDGSAISGTMMSPYMSAWIDLNLGGGDFTFNISSDVDGSYQFTLAVQPQYKLIVTQSPSELYLNAQSRAFIITPAADVIIAPKAYPVQLAVTCQPKATCRVSAPVLNITNDQPQASFTLTALTGAVDDVKVYFTAVDAAHVAPPAFLRIPIVPQQVMTVSGPSSVYSFQDATFFVNPSSVPTETFTVAWSIEDTTNMPGQLLDTSVSQTFQVDVNPMFQAPLQLVYRAPDSDVPTPRTIRLVGTITTLSGTTKSQFANPVVEFTFKGYQRFAGCDGGTMVYVSGGNIESSDSLASTSTSGVYTAREPMNGKPHYYKSDSGSSASYHIYYYIDQTTLQGKWILDYVKEIGNTPSANALYNSDESAPFSASWFQSSSNQPIRTLTVVCAPKCDQVGTSAASIEASLCNNGQALVNGTTNNGQCSLSCARYLPAVTATCPSLNGTVATQITALTTSCTSCNFEYVSKVLQTCRATLTSSDLTSDLSEVISFPTVVNPLSGSSSYVCDAACSTAYIPFYSSCVANRTGTPLPSSSIPHSLRLMYSACVPSSPPSPVTQMSFFGITSASMSLLWNVPTQQQATPLPLTYQLEQSIGANAAFTVLYSGSSAVVPAYTANGLTPGTVYRYRVTAVTAAGSSDVSKVFSQSTGLVAPAAPTSVVSSALTLVPSALPQLSSTYSLTLTWTDPSGSSSPTASSQNLFYQVTVSLTAPLFGQQQQQQYYGQSMTAPVVSLLPGATYTVSVTCRDSTIDPVTGDRVYSSWSAPQTKTITTPIIAPNTPSTPTLKLVRNALTGDVRIDVTWSNVGCGSVNCTAAAAYYQLQSYSVAVGAPSNPVYAALGAPIAFPVVDGSITTLSYSMPSAQPSTVYSIRVTASNSAGSATSSSSVSSVATAAVTPTVVPIPTYTVDITGTRVTVALPTPIDSSLTQLRFTFKTNSTTVSDTHDVYVSPVDFTSSSAVTAGQAKLTFDASAVTLLPEMTYSVVLSARNSAGWNNATVNQQTMITTPATPPRLVSCVASTSSASASSFSTSSIITLTFDRATNAPSQVNSLTFLDSFVSFPPATTIGAQYTGAWSASGAVLTLTVSALDAGRGSAPVIGTTQCQLKGALYNTKSTSGSSLLLPIDMIRVPLSGSFVGSASAAGGSPPSSVAHLVATSSVLLVDQDGVPVLISPALSTSADFSIAAGSAVVTATATSGTFVPRVGDATTVYTTQMAYALMQVLSSPLASLRYSPATGFVGTAVITITLNGTLGVEVWQRVVSVRAANHAPTVNVPTSALSYDIDATLATAVGVRLTGITISDVDSLPTSLTEIEFTQPTSLAARFKLIDALPTYCQSNTVTIGVWTAVLNLRCPYATLLSYVAAGGIVFTDPSIDMESTSTVSVHVRVSDHGSDLANGTNLSSEVVYLIRPSCLNAVAPKLLTAQVANDLRAITLTFDSQIRAAAGSVVSCATLVDAGTLALLSASSSCSISSSTTVTITLDSSAKLQIGNTITLNPSSKLLRRCASASAAATGSTTLLAPSSSISKPQVHLVGPSTIGVCESLTLEARAEGAIGAGALTYIWQSKSDASLLPVNTNSPFVTIPSVLMKSGSSYTFTVRVVTAFGVQSEVVSITVTKSALTVPSLVPVTVRESTLETDRQLELFAVADVSECLSSTATADQALAFNWLIAPPLSDPTKAAIVTSSVYPKLTLPPNTLTAGITYYFTLIAKQKVQSDTLQNTIMFNVRAVAPQSALVGAGGSGSGSNSPLTQSSQSITENSPVTVTVPSAVAADITGPYVWSCRLSDGSPCIDGLTPGGSKVLVLPPTVTTADGAVTLPAGTLTAPNTYVFTVTTRDDPSTVLTVITITVEHAVDVNSPSIKNNPAAVGRMQLPVITLHASALLLGISDSLFITSTLTSADGSVVQPYANLSYVWSSTASTSLWSGYATPTLNVPVDSSVLSATTASSLSIVPLLGASSIWSPGSFVSFRLTVTDVITLESHYSELSVRIAVPPHSGSFTISPSVGVALNTTFTFAASGWVGTGLLTYQYYYIAADGSQIRLGSHIGAPSDTDVMFPGVTSNSSVTIVLTVTDTDGFSTTTTQSIRVLPNDALMTNPVGLNNYLQDHIQDLTNTGAIDPIIALVNGQTAYNGAQTGNQAKCAAAQQPYRLTWSPTPTTTTPASGSSGTSTSTQASTLAATKLLIDSLTSILAADPSAATSPAVVSSCRTLLNDIVSLTSITLSASLRTTCTQAIDTTSSASASSPSLTAQFATTIALLNLNRRNTDINNGGAYTYNTVSASNRRRRLLQVGTSVTTNTTSPTAATLALSTRQLITSLASIMDRFSQTVLQVPGQLIVLPDCFMPSAVRRDLPSTLVSYIFDLDNTTVIYAQNWMSGTSATSTPIDTRMTYSTSNLYSFALNWNTDKLKPISGMMITSRTSIAAVPITSTRANPTMWVTLPFNTTACPSATCRPQCGVYNETTQIWTMSAATATAGVSTTYPSKKNIAGTNSSAFADCTLSLPGTTVALFATPLVTATSSSTGTNGGPTTDAQHANPREMSSLGAMPASSLLPSSPRTSAWAVSATMFFYLDSSFMSDWLKAQIAKDLVTIMQLTSARVQVTQLTAGSVLATFTITPDTSAASSEAAASGDSSPTPSTPSPTLAYNTLRSQLLSFISTGATNKLSSGALTRFAEDLRSASYVASRLCVDTTFQTAPDWCDAHGGFAKDGDALQGENGGDGEEGLNASSSSSSMAWYIIFIIVLAILAFLAVAILLAIKCRSHRANAQRAQVMRKQMLADAGLSSAPVSDASRRHEHHAPVGSSDRIDAPSSQRYLQQSSPPISSAPVSSFAPSSVLPSSASHDHHHIDSVMLDFQTTDRTHPQRPNDSPQMSHISLTTPAVDETPMHYPQPTPPTPQNGKKQPPPLPFSLAAQ